MIGDSEINNSKKTVFNSYIHQGYTKSRQRVIDRFL